MIEVYDRQKHFEMVRSWGAAMDPDCLGNGLIEPGVACIFADFIGPTRVALIYEGMTNKEISAFTRVRVLRELADKAMLAAASAGAVRILGCTRNPTVEHFFTRARGFNRDADILFSRSVPWPAFSQD